MEDTFLKAEEKKKRKEFLSLIVLVFTLLVGSSGLEGNTLYYLAFLASSLYYYLLLDRKRVSSLLIVFLPGFASLSFVTYLTTVYGIGDGISFNMMLYPVIFVVVLIGLLPENVRSEWRKRLYL